MAEDHLGKIFRIHSFGESHAKAVGVSIEGCPPLIDLDMEFIQSELDRRKPGQSKFTTQRKESDTVEILSGVYQNKTLGSPICMVIYNEDAKGGDYSELRETFRPSHADFTYETKYGIRYVEGGGRSSARVTAGWVAAGAIAKTILKQHLGVEILAYTKQIKDLVADVNPLSVTFQDIENSPVRCPIPQLSKQMEDLIIETKGKGDSLGGIIECVIKNVPAGLGEPLFGKLEADLAKACMSIPATKGFEVGSGFDSVLHYGSQLNDAFYMLDGKPRTRTNNSGGIQGGISNGMPIIFRTAFKPTATIFMEQETITKDFQSTTLKPRGRHDACVLPRAVPIVEAVAAIVMCDHFLRNQTALNNNI